MTTTLADQFISQPDWWITTGRIPMDPPPRYHDAKDCTLEADEETVGLYHLILGNNGIDSGHRELHVSSTSAASIKVVDVDNTHKDITFKNAAGAGVAPDQIEVSVRRLTSA